MQIARWINIGFVCVVVATAITNLYINLTWSIYFVILGLWLACTLIGSWFIRLNYFLNSLHSKPNHPTQHIAITFDDGPHPKYTQQVLELLKKHNAKATFFLIGKQVEENPNLVASIINDGHTIGNHTYSHSTNFGFYSTKKVEQELIKTNDLLKLKTGKVLQLFRPAFGVTNPNIAKAVKSLNLTSIGWSQRSLDTTSLSEDAVVNRVTKTLMPGDVILLHDTSEKSVVVLERLLLFLKTKDLKSVTVDQLFQIKAYA
jgi:peptidoglycan/xylan/chitin deacetylase (PgdA/CDA1 family)